MPPKFKFAEGERVLCLHGSLLYEGKSVKAQITKEKSTEYFIHYNGWNKSWDEWVPENRVLKYNQANLQRQKELVEQNMKNKKAKRKAERLAAEQEKQTTGVVKREASTPLTDGSRKKKSKLNNIIENEEVYISKVDVKINIPDDLKQWLVDDWDLITRQKQLVPLPRQKNINDILDSYIQHKTENPGEMRVGVVQEVVDGIREYFNVMLGTQLLYKFERPQYGTILAEHGNTPMSNLYGAEHLLRLFVKLGGALSYSNLDDKGINFVIIHIQDLLDFLSRNADMFFTTDYECATPEYHRRAAT